MASTQIPDNDVYTSDARVVAFFKSKEDAYHAINQLREAQFTSSEIGLMAGDESSSDYGTSVSSGASTEGHEGFWQKLKDFFSGESHESADYRDSSSGYAWDENRADYYYNGINSGGALVSVTGGRVEQARIILQNAGGDLRESGFESTATETAVGSDAERRIQLRGEVLRTYKERVQRGEVRLRKDVITENQNIQVPVTREELVVERVPTSGDRTVSGEIGTDEELRVPLSEERVRTEKQPVVTEEVRVGKRAVQSTENVSDDVRHEELRVDKDGDVNVNSEVTRSGKRKKPAA